ncbi:MAG TPA: MFS transporter, partial [Actinomycetes bacterium]
MRPQRFYGWRIVTALAVTETVSWGVLYYAFAVVHVPMRAELGLSAATTAGAFSVMVLVTGLAAVPVGRWVDQHGARGLMTAGSLAAVALVVAWSRVHTATGLYLVFAGIGLVSAAVLYEPAFAVVVRWFVSGRRRALLAVTVVAGFASTIFLPVSDALVRSTGWRDALLVLAGLLAVTTVLPHALVLRRDPADLGLRPDTLATATGEVVFVGYGIRAPEWRW